MWQSAGYAIVSWRVNQFFLSLWRATRWHGERTRRNHSSIEMTPEAPIKRLASPWILNREIYVYARTPGRSGMSISLYINRREVLPRFLMDPALLPHPSVSHPTPFLLNLRTDDHRYFGDHLVSAVHDSDISDIAQLKTERYFRQDRLRRKNGAG